MTNHWIDIKNSDCVLIIGSNAAENHPLSFKWVMKAKEENGAKVINVDPRFTRTSALSDIYAPLRSGTDIAFIGGMIYYVLQDMEAHPENYNMDYVKQYTNAALIINSSYSFNDGKFGAMSGSSYTSAAKDTWKYKTTTPGVADVDMNLANEFCVFQLLKDHYSRYTAAMVEEITGCPQEKFLEVCQEYAKTGAVGKAGTILYAMGATQHTYGTQNIRAYSILQLLLGNMGVAGGGINALRGENNVQGSTDMGLLYDVLPGYLKVPIHTEDTLAKYITRTTPGTITPQGPPHGLAGDKSVNWWGGDNTKKYVVSLLKAWYGDNATSPDFGFNYLPKIKSGGNYSHIALFEAMQDGIIKGAILWGQNPVVGGPNANIERQALAKLDWLVCVDLWETETSIFWKAPGTTPSSINTEVYLLPAAASVEKEGSVSNSGRWAQWRNKAVEPPGIAKSDAEIVSRLVHKLKELYSGQTDKNAAAINNLNWPYEEHPNIDDVAREINGYVISTGAIIASFANLNIDGTTASGNWLYCGMFSNDAVNENTIKWGPNRTKWRNTNDTPVNGHLIGLYPNWAWCWPLNRRIIYNRASVDLNGQPWDSEHPVIYWEAGAWKGDVVDGGGSPINVAAAGAKNLPFIMNPEGVGRIWGYGRVDGPLPEHYEPWESPLAANPLSVTKGNPCAFIGKYSEQGTPARFPYVATTYRVTEHWQTGGMTRNLPWLNELMPELFVELSEELAQNKSINNGETVIIETRRGSIEAVAIVTKRLQPLYLNGTVVHQVGLPWHWGYAALSKGSITNVLTPHVGDANTSIPEYKTFLCNVRKA